ncbi:hypothetical protein FOZ61_004011, partial [Perkinsus olseni]
AGCLKKEPHGEGRKYVLIQDNAPSHTSRYTNAFLDKESLKEHRRLPWPSNSPDLNPVKKYWVILKRKIYANNRQYNGLGTLWDAVQAAKAISSAEVENLTDSVDKRLEKLFIT